MRTQTEVASTPLLAVPGTHGWRGQTTGEWWCPDSPFWAFLKANAFRPVGGDDHPFVWSTDLNGAGFFQWLFGQTDWHSDWEAGGRALYYYYRPFWEMKEAYVPIADRNVIAHSHALQVVLKACSMGLKINRLVSVMSPVRKDMFVTAELARPNIANWLCLYSDSSDHTQRRGSWFDGQWRTVRAHPMADHDVLLPGVGHSRVLRDEALFPLWQEQGWLDWLRGGTLTQRNYTVIPK